MVTVNWMLDEIDDPETVLALNMLEHILVGTPASPLRKALIDSGLGEDLTGSRPRRRPAPALFHRRPEGHRRGGRRQGRGADPRDAGPSWPTTASTRRPIEASMNSFEFALRENNTGSFPRGMALMFRAMKNWLHGGDPLAPLAFEAPLAALKAKVAAGERVFEDADPTAFSSTTCTAPRCCSSADPAQARARSRRGARPARRVRRARSMTRERDGCVEITAQAQGPAGSGRSARGAGQHPDAGARGSRPHQQARSRSSATRWPARGSTRTSCRPMA